MRKMLRISLAFVGAALMFTLPEMAWTQARKAPPGMFKDLDDQIVGEAMVIHGKQLFIDDYLVGELRGATKVLHQPVKHPKNPLILRDRKSDGISVGYGAVVYDPADRLFKLWYNATVVPEGVAYRDHQRHQSRTCYATSPDGIAWTKPVTDRQTGANYIRFEPPEPWAGGAGVMIDPRVKDPERRFKMLYVAKPTGQASSLSTRVAYSKDGIVWKQEPTNPVIPFSDTQVAPYWDASIGRFVAYLRFGPPNIRNISRIESEDFIHWSPKVTVVKPSKLDGPSSTCFYGMPAVPYEGIFIGLLNTYHGETIQPIPPDKLWMDRLDVQLVFSRDGVTWQRVLREGAISTAGLQRDRDWKQAVERAVFLPNGQFKKEWDWGTIYPHHPPLVVGDEIRFYYTGVAARHWDSYHNDRTDTSAIGLATLRLDGFVSVEAGNQEGTLTTKPLVFIGDALQINANAQGGSIAVEALDPQGKVIEGFARSDVELLTADKVRHLVKWKAGTDCHLLQARPVRLKFYLKNARLYSFTPRILHNHYIQSYD